MRKMCAWCKTTLDTFIDGDRTSHGICDACGFHMRAQIGMPAHQYIDGLPVPVVVVAPPEGRVLAATEAMRSLLGKSNDRIVGFLGGEVFECDYSYLPEGCGRTSHCGACTIRRTVTRTFETGEPLLGEHVSLHQRTPADVRDLPLMITTQKVGDVVFLRIDG